MSDVRRVLLVGATGLVGTRVMEACVGRTDVRLVALTRREAPMPKGARMEMLVADPAEWAQSVAVVAPDAVICALGTTWRKAGERRGGLPRGRPGAGADGSRARRRRRT